MPTIGLLGDHVSDQIPASHRDLVECPPVAALTTITPDGYPQTSVVWCDFDGERVRINTLRGFAKQRNMRRDPRVTIPSAGRVGWFFGTDQWPAAVPSSHPVA